MKRLLTLPVLAAALVACPTPNPEGDACAEPNSGGGVLRDFCPPVSPGAKGVLFTASGEVLGLSGFAFPPPSADEPAFVDGWEVRLDRYLVTFDTLTLSEEPDRVPTDQSRTGALVATVKGPWAVDLHRGGPLVGKGGTDERAVAVAALKAKADGAAFDPARRYAFGFETVAATAEARNVNLDADGLEDYREMIAKGYSLLLVGTATFRGTSCSTSNANYDFTRLPRTVKFRFGFKTPTRYVNCLNPDLDGEGVSGEEHPRGVAIRENDAAVAQVTFHADHPFWDSFAEDAPLRFDPFAARHSGEGGTPTVTMEDFVGRGFAPFLDAQGQPVPYRACLEGATLPGPSALTFDTQGVAVNPAGAPADAIRDYADFVAYIQSTFGHLNADGLCFSERGYPSPH